MVHGYAIGDTHFMKANLTAMFPNLIGLQLLAIERVFKRALDNGVKLIVFLGDISEYDWLEDSVRSQFLRLLKKYDGRLDIRIFLGNHDVAENGVHSLHSLVELCSLEFFTSVKIMDKPVVEKYNGHYLEYLSWPQEKPSRKDSLVFAHYEVKGALRDNGRKVSSGSENFSSQPYIQGHLHTPHKVRNHHYVGTLYQTSFGERLPKGFGEFKFGDGFKYRHVEVEPPFVLENVVLSTNSDLRAYEKRTWSENTRVKLFVNEGLKLSPDFLLKHTEIVNKLDFSNEEERARLEDEELSLESDTTAINHLSILPKVMLSNGATKSQVRRAKEILKEL